MESVRVSTVFLLIVVGSFAGAAQAGPRIGSKAKECATSQYRLPERIVPEHYDLVMDVDTDGLSYEGLVRIGLTVNDTRRGEHDGVAANVLVLHAGSAIQIEECHYRRMGKAGNSAAAYVRVTDVCRFDENELLVLTLAEDLEHGARGELTIAFRAPLRDDMRGFYRSAYRAFGSGQLKYQATTQFEAADARKAFPCFDEPNFKATFGLTLIHDSELLALANTIPIAQEALANRPGRQLTKYKVTPRMSTYLLAFVIGEFDYVERVLINGAGGGLRIRAYTPVGRAGQGQFALDTAARAIRLMEEYFDIAFPLEKIDMIAIAEFDCGAMENWGLITYRESQFLFDEANSLASARGPVAQTVVHELSHQWFGNLVTMKWWNDLWLNEAFAAWMENYLTDLLYPELEWHQTYLVGTHLKALYADAQPTTHPVKFDAIGKNIDDSFDSIVYDKGAAIIKLVHDEYVGPERFRDGIRKYLSRHLHANTEASDLWDTLAEVSGLPVDQFMKSWITQAGHPIVRVSMEEDAAIDGGGKRLILEQRRHHSSNGSEVAGPAGQSWILPLAILLSDGKGRRETVQTIMEGQRMEVELPAWFDLSDQSHWLKVNENLKGFYRVEYPAELLQRLRLPCETKALEASDRLDLMDELGEHYRAGRIELKQMIDILGWFGNETEGSVLISLADNVKTLLECFPSGPTREQLDSVALRLFEHHYKRIGLELNGNELSRTDSEGLAYCLSILVRINYQPIIREALALFEEHGNQANQSIREVVYMAVAHQGSKEQQARLHSLFDNADSEAEQWRLKTALDYMETLNKVPVN